MLGCRLEPLNHKLQEPTEPYTHRATDPAQRNSLQQESFNQRTLLLCDHMTFWIEDKGTATQFAAVVLFSPYGYGRFSCTTLIHTGDMFLVAS
jgi:hypothetical protein